MARIRSVKPELFTHERLFEAESDYKLPLRLAFIALFTQCDQWGCFRWQPKRLKLNILPYDEIDIVQIFDALAERGFIEKYEIQGEWYGRIPSWPKHQRITRPEHPSGIPWPEGFIPTKFHKKNNPKSKDKISPPSLLKEALLSAIPSNVDAALASPAPIPANVIQMPAVAASVHTENEHGYGTASVSYNRVQTENVLGGNRVDSQHNFIQTESEQACDTGSIDTHTVHTENVLVRNMGCIDAHNAHTESVLGCNTDCIEYGQRRTWCMGNMEYGNGIGNREYGNGVGNNTIVASKTRPSSIFNTEPILKIFKHWQMVMKHPNTKLDPKRTVCIGKALDWGYSVEQLCEAITGCSMTPHNLGENDRGQRYDGLCLILRDSDQIDRFIGNYHCPPRPLTEAERKTKANIQSLQYWANQKMAEECFNGKD